MINKWYYNVRIKTKDELIIYTRGMFGINELQARNDLLRCLDNLVRTLVKDEQIMITLDENYNKNVEGGDNND